MSTYKDIDQLLELRSTKDKIEYLVELSTLIQDLYNVKSCKSEIDFLFDHENDKNVQQFIAYCFVRMIGNDNYYFLKEKRHIVFKYIQNALPEVCSHAKVTEKTENHVKEINFRDFIVEREKEIYQELTFRGNKLTLRSYQQSFRRFINIRKNGLLFAFCESVINKSLLDKVFDCINGFVESTDEYKYKNYLILKNVIEDYLVKIEENGTKYSVEILYPSFTRILEIAEEEIQRSPYYLPAEVSIYQTEKKYPFYEGIKNKINIGVRNVGMGFANSVIVRVINNDTNCFLFKETEKYVGNLKVESTIVEFDYEVLISSERMHLSVEVLWTYSVNKHESIISDVFLNAQTSNLEWDAIAKYKPYNLEPVEKDSELIGRKSILEGLKSMIAIPMGSAYIYGQRRVGKTSIVKTLLSSVKSDVFLIYYIEAGDWSDANNPLSSMDNLGYKICKKIKKFNPKFHSVEIPQFSGSLNRISDFLDDILEIDPEFRLLLILDEFDRISNSLYERGEIGRSFVLTIRAISNRPQIGFILVGGEKLEYILSQWQEFNKFDPIRVDYFGRERDWEDFKELIRKPVEGILDISDNAINLVYEETAGNPYFTKKICMELYANMINNRDTHVTEKEIFIASSLVRRSSNIGATDFSHFWEDGIKGKVEKEEETSLKRRKILIIMAEVLEKGQALTKTGIMDAALEYRILGTEVEKYLIEFEHRKIFQSRNSEYFFVVNFFKEWLLSGGKEKIIATFEEEERVSLNILREEEVKVKSEELLEVVTKLKIYKGIEINIDKVRLWIEQFDDVFDQRLIFKLLQNFKLYSEADIREKFISVFSRVRKELIKNGSVRVIDMSKKKRDDILVTYLDKSPAKGAPYFTKIFADVNSIYSDNVCIADHLEKKISEKGLINSIIIIDDFLGTGNTIVEGFKNYFEGTNLTKIIVDRNIPVFVITITGFLSAKEYIETQLDFLGLNLSVHICDVLSDFDRCFSNESPIFSNAIERKKAKEICLHMGEKLEPKMPLGYFSCECLIAFPLNCPNNTLPIFWKRTDEWSPLFERT